MTSPCIESEIVHILRDVRGGKTIADVCRAYGVSEDVVRRWLGEYRDLDQFEIRRRMDLKVGSGRSGRTWPEAG